MYDVAVGRGLVTQCSSMQVLWYGGRGPEKVINGKFHLIHQQVAVKGVGCLESPSSSAETAARRP